ncbi:Putative transmembrane transport protein [hydrothermal vent metagenome]|uniref:Transmembrane transport protein n=1 Tax=hydrothermal vent metagenome TaxID=652676 RepID=A0A3B1DX29_9ZZZZ
MGLSNFTRFGFILAASGSAVGLGNIWKFSYMVGDYGGSAFVLVYLLSVLFVGLSVLIAEIIIGYLGQSNAVVSFKSLTPTESKIKWQYAGFSAFTGLIILTFYSVVIGWILYYLFNSFFELPIDMTVSKEKFNYLLGNQIGFQIFFHLVSTLLIGVIIIKGVKNGIEKVNKILMPLLIIIILGLLAYSITLNGFSKAIDFMFSFDFSKLTSDAIVQAVGHSFFTLSIGIAAILTYAASLPKNTNIFKASIYIVIVDTGVAIISGIMLYAFVFEFSNNPSNGPGLVFVSLPVVFAQLGLVGTIFSILFFTALAFAGITSAISIIEPSVMYFIDKFNITRFKATIFLSSFFFIIGVLVLLSYTSEYGSLFSFFDIPLFDILDKLTTNILMPVGGLVVAIFIGFIVPKQKVYESLISFTSAKIIDIWYFNLRFIAIPALIFTLLNLIGIIKI